MPIDELQRRLGVSNAIKLASNENPLGASDQVKAALAAANGREHLALYPDGSGNRLHKKIAAMHDIALEWIPPGNGSNQLIAPPGTLFYAPNDTHIYSGPTFALSPPIPPA